MSLSMIHYSRWINYNSSVRSNTKTGNDRDSIWGDIPHPRGQDRHWGIIENRTAFEESHTQDLCKLVVGVILRLWVQNTWRLVNYNYSSTMPELGVTRRNQNPDNLKEKWAVPYRVRHHSYLSFFLLEFLPKDHRFVGFIITFGERGEAFCLNVFFRDWNTRGSSEHSGQGYLGGMVE